MSTAGILFIDDLKAITQLEKPGDIERTLVAQGIKIFRGRRGVIWTTLALVNAAGGIRPGPSDDNYDPEALID